MKPLKKATQKNFKVNMDYYTMWNLNDIVNIEGIEYLFGQLVVFAAHVKDVKVVLDEHGYYTNAVVMNSGEMVFVNL